MNVFQPVRRTFDKLKAKAKMDAAGKSYADLARPMGVTRQTIGHWFRDRGEPSVQQMKAMAKELGCHWLELVNEETTVVYLEQEIARLSRIRSLTPEALEKLDSYLEIEAGSANSPPDR